VIAVAACEHETLRALAPDGRCPLCSDELPITQAARDTAAHIVVDIGLRTINPEAIDDDLRSVNAALGRRSLYQFFKQAFVEELEPSTPLLDTWSVKVIADHVQWMLEGWLVCNKRGTPEMRARVEAHWARHGMTLREGQLLVEKLVMNIPPSTLKSMIVMVAAPAWMWLHCPEWEVCCISGVKNVVDRDSSMCRDLVQSAWYRDTYGVKFRLSETVNSVAKWQLAITRPDGTEKALGCRYSKKINEKITGLHVDAMFIDDPDDAQGVHNEPERVRVHNKWRRAIKNRIRGQAIFILLQQRVHVSDLSGFLLGRGTWSLKKRKLWAWLCLPARYGHGPKSLPSETPWGWTDPRKTLGEYLSERFDDALIEDNLLDLGSHGVASQYDQNPEPIDGGWFPRKLLRFFRLDGSDETRKRRPDGCNEDDPFVLKWRSSGLLDVDFCAITVDATFGSLKDTASAVGLQVVLGKGMRRFVIADLTEPMTFDQTKASIRKLVGMFKVDRVLIEKKANGAAVLEDLRAELAEGVLVEQVGGVYKRVPLVGPDGKKCIIALESIETGGDSKAGRARGMTGSFEANLIYLLDGADWLEKWLGEVCVFPNSKHDDRVDSLSQLIVFYLINGHARARAQALNQL
jgi:hypothetical protein